MIIIDLIYNLSVLIALSVLSGFIYNRFDKTSIKGQILQGFLFGFTAVVGMYYPFVLSEGIIFDGRSIVISLCALFFGPISGIISALITIIFRIFIDGTGVLMGVSVITSSFLIGHYFNFKRKTFFNKKNFTLRLYIFGLIVHAVMLILVLLLPQENIKETYQTISLTVIVVYPLVTILIGKILLDQEENKIFVKKIVESEKLFRTTLYSIGDAVITTDDLGNIVTMNNIAENLTGWKESEAKLKPLEQVFIILNEVTNQPVTNPVKKVFEEGNIVGLANHTVLISKDGKVIPIADSGSPIRNNENKIIGVVFVFRDQTEERARKKLLEENEERLRLSLSAANQGLYDLNVQTSEAVVNDEYASMLGYDPKTFIETNSLWIERLHPKDKTHIVKAYNDYIEGKTKEYKVEFRQRTKDNNWKWILSLGKIVEYDTKGKPLRMLGTHTDITERKKAEAEKFRLSKAIESSLNEIYIFDAGTLQFIDINYGAVKNLGYKKDDLLKLTPLNIKPDFNRQSFEELLIPLRTGEKKIIVFETRHLRADGTFYPVEVHLQLIKSDEGDHFLAIINDITECKAIHKKIEESRKSYENIFNTVTEAIYIQDTDGSFIDVNKGAESMYLMKREELIGKSPLDIGASNKNNYEELKTILNRVFETGKSEQFEFWGKRSNGEIFPKEVIANKGKYFGKDVIIATARDITIRRNYEIALRDSEAKYKFLFEHNPHPMYVYDMETLNFLAVNDTAILKYGYTKEEFLSMNLKDIRPQEEVDKLLKNISVSEGQILQSGPWKHKLKNGKIIFADIYSHTLEFDGKKARLIIANDVTEKLKAEEKLKNRNKDLAKLFEISINLLESVDKKQTLLKIIENANELIGLDSGAIYMIDKDNLVLEATTPPLPDDFPDEFKKAKLNNHPNILKAVNNSVPTVLNDSDNVELTESEKIIIKTRNLKTLLYLPLKSGNTVRGILILGTVGRTHSFSEAEIELCLTLSNIASLALENSILFDKLNSNLTELTQTIKEKNIARKALEESKERFQQLFENMINGVAIYDAVDDGKDFVFIDLNLAGQKLDKISKEEVIGKKVTEVFPGIKGMGLLYIFQNVYKTGIPQHHPLSYYKDGRIEHWVENYVYKLPTGQIIAVYEDTSKEKQAVEKLKESEEKFSKAFELNPDSITITSIDAGKLLEVNKGFETIFGYSRNEVIGKSTMDLNLWKNKEDRVSIIKMLEKDGITKNYIAEYNAKDGRTGYGEVSMVKIEFMGQKCLLTNVKEITQREKLNRLVKESEEKLRAFFESDIAGTIQMNINGKIDYCNREASRILGYSLEEIKQNNINWNNITTKEFSVLDKQKLKESFSTGRCTPYEKQIIRKDGNKIWILVGYVLLEPKREEALAFVLDLTSAKLAEQELLNSKNEISELAQYLQLIREEERQYITREIHDDLGQSLTALRIDTHWLKNNIETSEEPVLTKIVNMITLIDNTIKSVQKISSDLRPGILDDLGLVSAIEWELKRFEERTKIKCNLKIKPHNIILEEKINTPVFRLFQEACTNVARHSKATNLDILIQKEDNEIQMILADNGIGIKAEQINGHKSFGIIGMRERVNNLGGKIQFISKENKGTTVKISIPLT